MDSRFGSIEGVVRTAAGYTGGAKVGPTYRSLGDHTEAVQVEYDPDRVSYGDLLAVFWEGHDPTGQTWSRQYRNAVFWHDEGQRRAVEESRRQIEARLGREVRADVEPEGRFYPAEGYHQKYLLKRHPQVWNEVRARHGSDAAAEASTAAARINGYLGGNGSPAQDDLRELGLSPAALAAVEGALGR